MKKLHAKGGTGELRPTVLRIGVINNGKFIEERLLSGDEVVTVGQSPACTVVIPQAGFPAHRPLLRPCRGGGYVLVIEDGVTGKVSIDGVARSLRQWIEVGAARRIRCGAYELAVEGRARGKVGVGDVVVLFQFVEAPRPLPRPVLPSALRGGLATGADWSYLSFVLVILMLQIPFIYQLHRTPIPRGVSFEDLSPRWLALLTESPPAVDDPASSAEDPDSDVDEPSTDESPGEPEPTEVAEGAKHPRVPLSPEERARREAVLRARILASVDSSGLLVFIGSKGTGGDKAVYDVLEGGHETGDLDKFFAGVESVGVASADTAGDLVGTSERDAHPGDVVDLAAGGEDYGIGPVGSVKSGAKTKERKVEPIVETGTFEPPPGTSLDPELIAEVVRRRLSGVVACYERGLRGASDLAGKIEVRWTIGLTGRVITSATKVVKNDLAGSNVADCVVENVNRWRFPEPDGEPATVRYPFIFTAGG